MYHFLYIYHIIIAKYDKNKTYKKRIFYRKKVNLWWGITLLQASFDVQPENASLL